MRKVVIRQPKQISPFNEPATNLTVLGKPLNVWQRDILSPFATEESVVEDFQHVSREPVETLIFKDNLWFDVAFITSFIDEARQRQKPVRAAFRAEDKAFMQHGLAEIVRSYERRGDLLYMDLWYFPNGPTDQVEPVIVDSGAREMVYYTVPASSTLSGQMEIAWWVPVRAACALDTWLHLYFINIVYGAAVRANMPVPAPTPGARLFEIFERRPFRSSGARVEMGEGCHIDPSATFSGMVTLGDNVTVGPGCVVSESIIGDNVTLAHGNALYMSVVGKNCFFPGGAKAYFSLVMDGSTIGQNASLEMTVIGRHTYVGAGTVFSNTNLLPGSFRLNLDYGPVDVNIPVIGGCVGHNCRIGAGLVFYPARTVESDTVLFPSPTRRVIMNDISYEESDHHSLIGTTSHPRRYPRELEQESGF